MDAVSETLFTSFETACFSFSLQLDDYLQMRAQEAVKKMTSLPARKLGIEDGGLVEPGCWTDLVVFDPDGIADTATYLDPYRYPKGIGHDLVNGVPVIKGGEHTGALPGRALRHRD